MYSKDVQTAFPSIKSPVDMPLFHPSPPPPPFPVNNDKKERIENYEMVKIHPGVNDSLSLCMTASNS